MKYRARVPIEAITFEELVKHCQSCGAVLHNGMPWSFLHGELDTIGLNGPDLNTVRPVPGCGSGCAPSLSDAEKVDLWLRHHANDYPSPVSVILAMKEYLEHNTETCTYCTPDDPTPTVPEDK